MVGISKDQKLTEFLGIVCIVAKFKDFKVYHSPSVFEISKFQRYFVVTGDIQLLFSSDVLQAIAKSHRVTIV